MELPPDRVTQLKREQLMDFVRRVVVPSVPVKCVVGIGSVALGSARADSDIDAAVFLDPFDYYVLPGEFAWSPSGGSFHSPFSSELPPDAIQLDFLRLDLSQWTSSQFLWSEPRCHELAEGWVAYDRDGTVADLIRTRTEYTDQVRQSVLDEALVRVGHLLPGSDRLAPWETLGPAEAHDRLNAAADYLSQAVFAVNRRWRPWRGRQANPLRRLPWLPEGFPLLSISVSAFADFDGYRARAVALGTAFEAVLNHLIGDPQYGEDPLSTAFKRTHNHPGYAWNMAEWNDGHRKRAFGPTP